MTVDDVKHLANRFGLVIMEFVENYTPYAKGDKAGFHPKEALGLFEHGVALFAARPNIKPQFIRSSLDTRVGADNPPHGRAAEVKTTASPTSAPDGSVDIPENWEKLHHLKRINIAAKIKGVDFKEVGGDENAKTVIRDEIARRVAKAA